MLHGDKGYYSDAIRRQVGAAGGTPNIPPKENRRWKPCFSPALYRDRNAIERMFWPPQGLQARPDALRPPRLELPRRRPHHRDRQLVMSPGPSVSWLGWRVDRAPAFRRRRL